MKKRFLMGYIAGFYTCWKVWKHAPVITPVLQGWVAKLQLKNDIIKHDHPEVG